MISLLFYEFIEIIWCEALQVYTSCPSIITVQRRKKKDTENSEEMGVPQPPGGISHHLANKKDSGKQWGKKDFVGIA